MKKLLILGYLWCIPFLALSQNLKTKVEEAIPGTGNKTIGPVKLKTALNQTIDSLRLYKATPATWNSITGKPSTFPPATHNHDLLYYPLSTNPNSYLTQILMADVVTALGYTPANVLNYSTTTASDAKYQKKLTAGTNIVINTSDPDNPIISSTGGGGTGDTTYSFPKYALNHYLSLKVDKVTGKGLSQEDYSTAEKSKLAGLPSTLSSTTDLAEGSNQYFTNARARATQSVTGGILTYNSSTGVHGLDTNLVATRAYLLYREGVNSIHFDNTDFAGTGSLADPITVIGGGSSGLTAPQIRQLVLTNYTSNALAFTNGDSIQAFANKAKYQIETNTTAIGANTTAIGTNTTNIGLKSNTASPTFTGTLTAPLGTTTVSGLIIPKQSSRRTASVEGTLEVSSNGVGTSLYLHTATGSGQGSIKRAAVHSNDPGSGRVLFVSSDGYGEITDNSAFNFATTNGILTAGRMNISGAASASSVGTNGIGFTSAAFTYTNSSTAASGTVAHTVVHSFRAPTFAATNTSVTYTKGTNAFFQSPIAGTNVTIGTILSAYFEGNIEITGRLLASGISGTATLASGTVTVSNTLVRSGTKVLLTYNTPSGTQGFLSAPAASIVASTSFVINSSSGSDNSTVNYLLVE